MFCVNGYLKDEPVRTMNFHVFHDLSSPEPRSKVEPSSRSITLHQVELGSADPIQLNGRGYTGTSTL